MPSTETGSNPAHLSVKTFGVSWPLLVALLVLLGVLGLRQFNMVLADPDTYFHIAAGRWILDHGTVPANDPFLYSMPGASWTAHEWLSEVVLAGIHALAGWAGLVVFVALLFAGTLAYLTRFLLTRMEPAHALLLMALAASMCMAHLLARPHVLIWPLLAVWVGSLANAAEQVRRPPWWLLPLMTLWANLHGSFVLGLALGIAFALDAVLHCPREQRRAVAARWIAFAVSAVAAAMITPAGWHGILFLFHVMQMKLALDVFSEWRSPDFHQPEMLEFWLLLMLFLAGSGRMRLPWLRLLLVLGLTHLALKHGRNVSILGLVSPFLIASALGFHWRATKAPGRDAEALDRLFHALAAPASRCAIPASTMLAILWIGIFIHFSHVAPVSERTPEAAVQAAASAGAAGPVFNSQEFGGYLIYRGIPAFIDGRADMYGDALLKRYLDAVDLRDTQALPQLLDDYHIRWTLLAPGTPALALLDHLPGWRRLYADRIAVVHIREDGQYRALRTR